MWDFFKIIFMSLNGSGGFIFFFVFVTEMWKLVKRERKRQWVGF